jgi:hypothetical protein
MVNVGFDTSGTNSYVLSARDGSLEVTNVVDSSLTDLLSSQTLSSILKDRPLVPEFELLSYPTDSRVALTLDYLREQVGPRPSPISSDTVTSRRTEDLAGSFALSS